MVIKHILSIQRGIPHQLTRSILGCSVRACVILKFATAFPSSLQFILPSNFCGDRKFVVTVCVCVCVCVLQVYVHMCVYTSDESVYSVCAHAC